MLLSSKECRGLLGVEDFRTRVIFQYMKILVPGTLDLMHGRAACARPDEVLDILKCLKSELLYATSPGSGSDEGVGKKTAPMVKIGLVPHNCAVPFKPLQEVLQGWTSFLLLHRLQVMLFEFNVDAPVQGEADKVMVRMRRCHADVLGD